MTRRAFLAAAALAAAGGGLVYRSRPGDFESKLDQTAEAARLFDELEAAQRIGRVYLDDHPEEADLATLVRLLEKESGWRTAWEGPSERIAELARWATRHDYDKGRIVAVEGWILSRTEARLCALTTFG
jgi:hypothetical protein